MFHLGLFGGVTDVDELITEALAAFGMAGARYELIRRNENITCRVSNGGNQYVLRIHSPVEGFRTSLAAGGKSDAALFRSETDLLRYMAGNGFDGLQQPVANPAGEYVTELKNGIPAMMLTWVEGRPVTNEEGRKYAREAGRLACRIHRAAKGFTGERLQYDSGLSSRMADEIRRAVSEEHISEGEGRICIRELDAVIRTQKRLETSAAPCVIHADLGFSNILITDNGLIPIDFSMSGYASPAQEAGMLMSNYQDEDAVQEILMGFEESGDAVSETDAKVFLSYSVLLFICMHHDRVFREEWFGQAMKRWCETLFVH